MGQDFRAWVVWMISLAWAALPARGAEPAAAALPGGVKAAWGLEQAWREETATRGRVSLNGLWRWQPAQAGDAAEAVPSDRWGHFKVPGAWPGITDYMQKDCQTVFAHPAWKDTRMGGVTSAWYQREFTVPAGWGGRRITLAMEYLNSYAAVYVDGQKAGEARFPAGEVDLTAACRPGATHVLSLRVDALPLKGVLLSYTDSASAREVKGAVARRGLCGDVYLVSTPATAHVGDVRVETSVRKGEIAVVAAVEGLAAERKFVLQARVMEGDREVAAFKSGAFGAADLKDGRIAVVRQWKPEKLWDLHTPGNVHELRVALLDENGAVVDEQWGQRFGFREFWIDGRDFYLNGTRVFLSSVPLDNAQVGAAWASYEGARESLRRLKSFGINFVYTHNYDCLPGSHLSFAEILRAADDEGMLVALSQPHFSHYDWKAPNADDDGAAGNGYARHAAFYAGVAANHPSVIAYAMSHNATGYTEDMNPDLIDGVNGPRDQWASNNAKLALRAEAIVKKHDPARIVYHHAGGNLGAIYTSNFYANFAPVQEMSDWFGHWATKGVKPLFTCEYAVPFTWDWTMYRGWYKGQREFGSAKVPWEFCLAEWNAQFVGDKAYAISEAEKTNLRWEAKQFAAGNTWHRWDYPHQVGSSVFDERYPVIAKYINDNWRAFRTWGVSANSPWEYGHYWKPKPGVKRGRETLAVDWEKLQRPGFSADYVEQRYERMDLAFGREDWVATPAAQALIRNNGELLAYVGGKEGAFTTKEHNCRAGETVEKQLIVINNSRRTVVAECAWTLALPEAASGKQRVTIETGQQHRAPMRVTLPGDLPQGRYELRAEVRFEGGEVQADSFWIDVLPAVKTSAIGGKVALFDPKGETAALLKGLGIVFEPVEPGADLSKYETLVIGKGALTLGGAAPDVSRVREGLKVVVFEQTGEVLEKRLGFRVTEYGLREVFARVKDHPLLAGLGEEHLQDWRGEATLLPPRLTYETRPRYGPTVQWAGIPVTRLWRGGNRGSVASVLIEKPACGDFLPVVDGGYGLQYSPLMEYREGKGMVLFCQMDVSGRTEADPAAEMLARNVMEYVGAWRPAAKRNVVYAGEEAGRRHLEAGGVEVRAYDRGALSADEVLVVGPGGGEMLKGARDVVGDWLKRGGKVLAMGLDEREANAFLPRDVAMKTEEHIGVFFETTGRDSFLAGVASADVHNRDPRRLPLVTSGATVVGNGVLARGEGMDVVFCQLAPWQFEGEKQANLKRTFRRVSVLTSRLLGNLGVSPRTPLLDRLANGVANEGADSKRWLKGFYLDQPEEWDDPYRFFRW